MELDERSIVHAFLLHRRALNQWSVLLKPLVPKCYLRSMRRILITCISIAALSGLLLPAAASAVPGPDLSGFVPDFTEAIPFLAEGSSATVGGVEVTASTNTGVVGDGPNTYLHQSNSRIRTVLEFDKPIPGFKAQIRLHDDCPEAPSAPPDCFEQYHIVGLDDAGNVVFDKTIRNANVTFSVEPGSGADETSDLIATLEFDYTHDVAADFMRGSYLDLWITDTYIAPASQTLSGTAGDAITATTAFDATGFTGAVTYAITDGELPAGLHLNPNTGVISGTPTGASNATITITATGATTGVATATITFSISIASVDQETLADTGANMQLSLYGLASLLVGASAIIANRRRAAR